MFERIAASWGLVKASAAVLKADKELLIFPLVSGLGVVLVTLTFAAPLFFSGLVGQWVGGQYGADMMMFIVAFLYYLVQYFVIFFANTALVGAAIIRLNGGAPTVGDGFRVASQRFNAILGYALIAATVGMLLRAISERGGILGQITSAIVGTTWSVATFLVVPVLVVENVGPIEAVKRSTALLKKTWGEQVVGSLSMGFIFGLLAVLVILAGIGLGFLATSIFKTILVPGVVIVVLVVMALLVLSLVGSALNGIYTAAVYSYATGTGSGSYFDAELLRSTFRRRDG
jgi:MFS family permease